MMHSIDMTDRLWARLLAVKAGRAEVKPDPADPVLALYEPIAAARGRFVLAQVGQSLDGRVATPSGDARDISCPEGIAHLHRCRALVDAVIVGVTTVQMDDPRLSVRAVTGPNPVRVVIDCDGVLTGRESLFHDGLAPVLVIRGAHAPEKALPADTIALPRAGCGITADSILAALDRRGLSKILVEGGARTIARFVDAGLVDRLHISIAPLIIGSGPAGIALSPIERLSSACRPVSRLYSLGDDILFDCDLKATSARQGQKVAMADAAEAAGRVDGILPEGEPRQNVA
ncbi:RibD family protein [Rhizobium sp. YIM 134829]|uniref:RibD family protein n=1 Tax=Rhizobium sp. YIM 134829 TaxID=3390453 RepID=UPI00397B7FE8